MVAVVHLALVAALPFFWTPTTSAPGLGTLSRHDGLDLFLLASPPAPVATIEDQSQQEGGLQGVVVDESGGVVSGARITVLNESGVVRANVLTVADGSFAITGLPDGHYRVQAESAVFDVGRADVVVSQTLPASPLRITLRVRAYGQNVTVTAATRSDRPVQDLPASVSVVPNTRIAETPGLAVDDVLRTVPSIDLGRVSSYAQHPTSNNPSIRGQLSGVISRMLVTVDGVPINDAFSGFVQWSRVPQDLVQQVEVVRGGGSTVWGTYATSGIVNIVTRAPSDRELSVDAGYGGFDSVRLNAFGSKKLSPRFTLAGNGSWYSTDGFNAVPEDLRRPLDVANAFKAGHVNVQGNFSVDPTLTGFLRGQYFHDHQTLGTPAAVNHQDSGDVSGGVTKTMGTRSLTAHAYYHDGEFVTDNVATPEGEETRFAEFVQNRHTTDSSDYGISIQHSQRLNQTLPQLQFGFDYHEVTGEDEGDIFDETGQHVRTDVGRGKQRGIGAYGLISIVPAAAFELLGSVRWDYWRNFDGFDGTTGRGAVPTKTANAVSPRIGARYRIRPQVAVRAAGYGSFNAPNLDNLYRAYATPGFIGLPNSQLEPERGRGGEAGLDITTVRTRIQATVFRATIKNAITFRNVDPTEPVFPPGYDFASMNINAGKLRSQGFEAEATHALRSDWRIDGAYTYADSVVTENPLDPASVGRQIDGVPKHALNAGVANQPVTGFGWASRVRWTSAYTALFSRNPLERTAVVDASARYAFTPRLTVYVNVQNLLNRDYIADDNGFVPPQRGMPFNVFLGVRAALR